MVLAKHEIYFVNLFLQKNRNHLLFDISIKLLVIENFFSIKTPLIPTIFFFNKFLVINLRVNLFFVYINLIIFLIFAKYFV